MTLAQSTAVDSITPTIGASGALTSGTVGATAFTASWSMGTDDTDIPSGLRYLVYYSASNNISSVANAEANGTAVGSYA